MSDTLVQDALRIAEILARIEPMPTPREVYSPATGADWAFIVATLDGAARMVGPLAQRLKNWEDLHVCEEHKHPIYHAEPECPACREVEYLCGDSTPPGGYGLPGVAKPPRAQALRHAWDYRVNAGAEVCSACGVRRDGRESEFCGSRVVLT